MKPVFQLVAPFQPAGDQPQAIEALTEGLRSGKQHQVLMGVTGSGKTFTMANVIQNVQRPALVGTCAARRRLCDVLRENAVSGPKRNLETRSADVVW